MFFVVAIFESNAGCGTVETNIKYEQMASNERLPCLNDGKFSLHVFVSLKQICIILSIPLRVFRKRESFRIRSFCGAQNLSMEL